MLFRKQRNEFFELLVNKGFSPTDFKEKSDETNKYEVIYINDKRFKFELFDSNSSAQFKLSLWPMHTKSDAGAVTNTWGSWANAIRVFTSWLNLIKDEFQTPDLWAEAQSNAQLFASSSATPDEMFSDNELRELQGQIRRIEQGIIALGLPANAQKALLESIKEAPDKATRFTKKEWQGWFIGAVVSQVTNLALSPEHVSAVAQLLKSTFMGLLQLH